MLESSPPMKKLNGYLYTSVTVCDFIKLKVKNVMISTGYHIENNYPKIMKATSLIPFFCHSGIFGKYNDDDVLDGGITNNIPRFEDKKRK